MTNKHNIKPRGAEMSALFKEDAERACLAAAHGVDPHQIQEVDLESQAREIFREQFNRFYINQFDEPDLFEMEHDFNELWRPMREEIRQLSGVAYIYTITN